MPDVDRTDHLGGHRRQPDGLQRQPGHRGGLPRQAAGVAQAWRPADCHRPGPHRTAALADWHLAPRPGTDGLLLLAVVHVLFDEDLVADDLGGIAEHVTGVETVRALGRLPAPGGGRDSCGVAAQDIRQLARDIAAAPSAAVYGRIGTSTVEFGTLGSWVVDVVNADRHLDRPGG